MLIAVEEADVALRLPVNRVWQRCEFCSEEAMRRRFLRVLVD
jgi:hypothetical protein